jgi:cytochrome c-type biogenesis protein CcmH
MTLWIILTFMVAVVAAVMTIPLVRRHEARADARTATLAVLRDQLADVDVQLAAGAIPPADAEGLRIEIKRRMLAAGHIPEEARAALASRTLSGMAIGLAALVALAGGALYATMGKPGLAGTSVPLAAATAPAPAEGAAAEGAGEIAALVAGLEKKVAANADDPEGWRMLGWSYFQMQRFDDSARAYGKAVALKPDGAGFQSAYGEALVQAANGAVTPAAAEAFAKARAQDGADARARYFLGVKKQQDGDAAGALAELARSLRRRVPHLGRRRACVRLWPRAAAGRGPPCPPPGRHVTRPPDLFGGRLRVPEGRAEHAVRRTLAAWRRAGRRAPLLTPRSRTSASAWPVNP